jgi:uncharacterized protein (TIGR03435 family)
MRRLAHACVLATFYWTSLHAAGPSKTFAVSTVKPNESSDNRVMLQVRPGGRFTATGVTLKLLIAEAYDVRDFQIAGGPGWINTDRWDIVAKAEDVEGQLPIEEFRPMLRALIEERFQLKVKHEARDMQVYALLQGKNGSKLEPPSAQGPQMRMGRGEVIGKKVTMAMLARSLGQMLGRPVVDKTDLTNEFDFTLKYTREPGQGGLVAGPPGPPGPEAAPPGEQSGPSIFTAVQEQLGLKLDSQKAPVDTIVIDHVEKPSEN